MAPHNIYVSYKKDTKYLLYWMINVSNRLIKSTDGHEVETPVTVNTTGQTTVAGLISMSKLIAERREPIPSVIYRLFGSIIEARSVFSGVFQQLAGSGTDEELKRSNASHQHFIDTLRESFSILGGDTWAKTQGKDSDVEEDEDVETIIANKFRALTVEVQDEGFSDEDDDDDQPQARKASRRSAKGKKGKKSKKNKKQKKTKNPATVKEGDSDEIPIESIKIIEDEDFSISDYLIAVYSAVKEWVELRAYVQGTWREVAYDGLNGAAAAAISNMALSMIKRTTSTIFVDFPGHDSYETIMKTITRGDPDKAQGMFTMMQYAVDDQGTLVKKSKETAVNVKEQFLIYAYQDLVDFVTDFQANRSGKPTKAMQTKIAKNGLIGDAATLSDGWGGKHVYERVDWSANGPWGEHRTIFGLNEFAGEITSMAMKKPGTDVRKMIQPHHVFQLQCIVDAFAVSRGWSLSAPRGHILEAPAKDFRPRRDVDRFLDRHYERRECGYLQSVRIITEMLEKDGRMGELRDILETMQIVQGDFIEWLGETMYMNGLKTIPPSRFSDHNTNGLWEYSPFLCGIGLMEGLELSYRLNMILWEQLPEPILLIHLHHAAVQKGHLSRSVGLYQVIEDMMTKSFFVNGKPPTSNFDEALVAKIGEIGSLSQAQRRALRQSMASASNIHQMLDLSWNTFYRETSNLALYRKADWNIDAVPDNDLAPSSFLFIHRIGGTKKIVDPDTKRIRLEETPLPNPHPPQSVMDAMAPEGFQMMPALEGVYSYFPGGIPDSTTKQAPKKSNGFSGTDLLDIVRMDVVRDVQGHRPLSCFNHLSVAISFLIMFSKIEDRLREAKDPAYIEAFERPLPRGVAKRAALTVLALSDEHDETLRLIAEVMDSRRSGFMRHVYWEDKDINPELETREKRSTSGYEGGNECTLM
ncbi:hypothetical protein NM208_g5593 [Fusarium decemcellulare]|uniref:Uncharacterized protein n=1 Tax=Fusarium decemcellulare TaxID=57161 RepID=A0ACC1SG94_9HYPO|nr:hypothetical protein NM208_g5593 [Fusarium decemcellulare]